MSLVLLHRVMEKIKDQNNVIVYNPTSVDFGEFEFNQSYVVHTITQTDIDRPELLSYLYYNTTKYAYFILRINDIFELDNMRTGVKIKIPNVNDIKDFIFDNEKDT